MRRISVLFVFSLLFEIVLILVAFSILQSLGNIPKKAPEAQRIREAEAQLPFQVLIPAYLPKRFDRANVQIQFDQAGPQGESMIRLVYSDRYNNQLILSEWVPADRAGANVQENDGAWMVNANWTQAIVDKEFLRVKAEISSSETLTPEQLKSVLDTLGSASGVEVYASLKQVPLENSLPPAVEIPVNAEGIQELVLVVTPEGYSPAHFSVKKGVPVRLTFKQLGYVDCGNELLLQWGSGRDSRQQAYLILPTPGDKQTLEFTPEQTGVFQFNCPHLFYIGAMTVID